MMKWFHVVEGVPMATKVPMDPMELVVLQVVPCTADGSMPGMYDKAYGGSMVQGSGLRFQGLGFRL